ncbi:MULTISPECIES: hypothetical protein [unclassified Streptomyces]|nr:hypothetical protein [Streptomyces sp. TSRI0107]
MQAVKALKPGGILVSTLPPTLAPAAPDAEYVWQGSSSRPTGSA